MMRNTKNGDVHHRLNSPADKRKEMISRFGGIHALNCRSYANERNGKIQASNFGDSNIAKIAAPVLIISGDNDGLDKIELMKTYKLLGGGVTADLELMPKSHLAIVPSQSHVSLMMQTTTILDYLNNFLQ